MEQIKLKTLLLNMINEIENNEQITIDEIINKMSLEIESNIFT